MLWQQQFLRDRTSQRCSSGSEDRGGGPDWRPAGAFRRRQRRFALASDRSIGSPVGDSGWFRATDGPARVQGASRDVADRLQRCAQGGRTVRYPARRGCVQRQFHGALHPGEAAGHRGRAGFVRGRHACSRRCVDPAVSGGTPPSTTGRISGPGARASVSRTSPRRRADGSRWVPWQRRTRGPRDPALRRQVRPAGTHG